MRVTSRGSRILVTSSSRASWRSLMSSLFARATTGICPTVSRTPVIHAGSSFSVLRRVRSKTARIPRAPLKYASLKSCMNVRFPMMSRITRSTCVEAPRGSGSSTVFFETTAPSVRMYSSSNCPVTNRRIREVFPTPSSPTRQILSLMTFGSMGGPPLRASSRTGA